VTNITKKIHPGGTENTENAGKRALRSRRGFLGQPDTASVRFNAKNFTGVQLNKTSGWWEDSRYRLRADSVFSVSPW
jgi:hypothetical protein